MTVEPATLIDAIVEANRISRKEELEESKKSFQSDPLTKALVQTLSSLFNFLQIILVFLSIATVIASWRTTISSGSSCHLLCTATCWIILIFGGSTALYENHQYRSLPKPLWLRKLVGVIAFIMGSAFFYAFLCDEVLLTLMAFFLLSWIMFFAFRLLDQSMQKEYDRAYLVSFFSAIISFAALVIAIVSFLK